MAACFKGNGGITVHSPFLLIYDRGVEFEESIGVDAFSMKAMKELNPNS